MSTTIFEYKVVFETFQGENEGVRKGFDQTAFQCIHLGKINQKKLCQEKILDGAAAIDLLNYIYLPYIYTSTHIISEDHVAIETFQGQNKGIRRN